MENTGFKGLQVWQMAKDLAVQICQLVEQDAIRRNFALVDQMRRSAISVPSNIAEGDERDTYRDAVRFLYIAKGSLAELRTQLEIAADIGNINQNDFIQFEDQCKSIGRMLGSLIKARSK